MAATTLTDEIRSLRSDAPGSPELRTDAFQLADRIDQMRSASERATALGDVKRSLGNDAVGVAAFNAVLLGAQTPSYMENDQRAADRSSRMHDAFSAAVADGSIRPADIRPMVDAQSKLRVTDSARLSSYFDHLPLGTAGESVRTAVIDQSLSAARGLAPVNAGQMYAQAANGLADLSAANRNSMLDRIDRGRPGMVATIANGAVGGYGDRLLAGTEHHYDTPTESFRVDGVSKLLSETGQEVAAATKNRVDPQASKRNSELFTGATSYLSKSGGSPQDLALGQHDNDTQLRNALSYSLETNASRIVAGSLLDARGGGLSEQAQARFSGYSRFEADAALPGQNSSTIPAAQAALGKLMNDLDKGVIGGPGKLAAEFPGAFPSNGRGVDSAAQVLGNLINSTSEGINASVLIATQRGQIDAAYQKGLQNFGSGVATIAAAATVAVPVVSGAAAFTAWAIDHADRPGADTSSISQQSASLSDLKTVISNGLDRHAPDQADSFRLGADSHDVGVPAVTANNPLNTSLSTPESRLGNWQPQGQHR